MLSPLPELAPLRIWTPGGLPIRTAGPYSGPFGARIRALKYQDCTHHARQLGIALGSLLERADDELGLVPIPLHPLKAARRGFNQSALIAKNIPPRHGLQCRFSILRRIEQSRSQVELNSRERRALSHQTFQAYPAPCWAKLRRILLVDDVVTTGATFDRASFALRSSGYWVVGGLSVCRSEPNSSIADKE
ncbi:MAG: hypothetical protein MK135_17135 [Polyangiaceae bacterium]|nr:hypothetical protein [Polyangiaceae bacterium]